MMICSLLQSVPLQVDGESCGLCMIMEYRTVCKIIITNFDIDHNERIQASTFSISSASSTEVGSL